MIKLNRRCKGTLAALVLACAGVSAVLLAAAPAGAGVTTYAAVADGFTASDLPNTVENTSYVSQDGSPSRYGYYKFTVAVAPGELITSAVFQCWAGSGNSAGMGLWTAASTWAETTLTWNNAPPANFALPPAGSTGAVTSGRYNPADVSSAITGSGTFTLVGKTTSSTQWSCVSKENSGNHPPQLVVTTAPAPPPTSSTPPPTSSSPPPGHTNTVLPARGAFYYPWYPETWGSPPQTRYNPTLGFYDSTAVAASHVASLNYGGFGFAVSSWWGQGSPTDGRTQGLLNAAHGTPLKIAAYYEAEGNAVSGVTGSPNPTSAQITADLNYIAAHYVQDPNYMWVADRPVVFAFGDAGDSCAMNDRWAAANVAATQPFYVVLKVFAGYAACANQPGNWHQYGPATRVDQQGTHSYSLSPGYNKWSDPAPLLARDPAGWPAAVQAMNCAAVDLRLITTFNEWGEGTSVESAAEWSSASGQGTYLDALHADQACGGPTSTPPPSSTPPSTTPPPTTTPPPSTTPPPPPGSVVVTAAGDIACETALAEGTASCAENLTGNLIRSIAPDASLTLGDNQYNAGQLAEYNGSYNPAWGSFKPSTFPVAGNHEWGTPSANGYRQYFGSRVPQDGTYWYSYNVGAWHFLALDSDCAKFGGCGAGTPEYQFVVNDLAANNGKPTIAYWHHPRWSSGTQHGSDPIMGPIFDLLVADHDVSIQLSGHEHNYERNARLNAAGVPDPAGVMVWTVGSGGKNHYCGVTNPRRAGSAVFNCDTFGVLKLTLRSDGSFDYVFMPAPGTGSFTDSGTVAKRP